MITELPPTRTERLALPGAEKVALVEAAYGFPLAADVARAVAAPECDPKAMIMWLLQAPPPDSDKAERFFHDRRAGGW